MNSLSASGSLTGVPELVAKICLAISVGVVSSEDAAFAKLEVDSAYCLCCWTAQVLIG